MNENGDCSTLFVNQIQTGFAFASKIDYLCRRESDNALSLFHALLREAMQYNCKYVVICIISRANLRQVTRWFDANYK